jgi:hypothetical protein
MPFCQSAVAKGPILFVVVDEGLCGCRRQQRPKCRCIVIKRSKYDGLPVLSLSILLLPIPTMVFSLYTCRRDQGRSGIGPWAFLSSRDHHHHSNTMMARDLEGHSQPLLWPRRPSGGIVEHARTALVALSALGVGMVIGCMSAPSPQITELLSLSYGRGAEGILEFIMNR